MPIPWIIIGSFVVATGTLDSKIAMLNGTCDAPRSYYCESPRSSKLTKSPTHADYIAKEQREFNQWIKSTTFEERSAQLRQLVKNQHIKD